MPLPVIMMIAGFYAVVAVVAVVVARASTRSYRPVAQEQERAARLATCGDRVEALVTAWARHPGGSEEAPRMLLKVRFPHRGSTCEAELVARIDRGLVAGFAPGRTVHLLVDPVDPGQVAIDRSRSIVELPGRR